MFYKEKPKDFQEDFNVVGCFLKHQGKMLMLRRAPGKREEGKWGLPGGKVDAGESLKAAMQREILEETGLAISQTSMAHIDSVYVQHDDYSLVYHMFSADLSDPPEGIKLNPAEHVESAWMDPGAALRAKDMMKHMDDCIRLTYGLQPRLH